MPGRSSRIGTWSRAASRAPWLSIACAALLSSGNARAEAPRTELKVCADPYSMPSSNREQQGYENKIAELLGRKLGLPVRYEWFPQRMGFIRNTLTNNDTPDGSYRCDLVMSVTENFDMAAPTRPYMRSAWAMVYVKGRGLDFIQSQDDLLNVTPEQRALLRIGIFDKGPATDWIAQNDLMDRATPFQSMTGDTHDSPGRIIERDLIQDHINLTFLWGPIAGYYAQQAKSSDIELAVIPLRNESGRRFDFQIAMAVRHPDKAWKAEVNRLIEDNQAEIDAILQDYGVPLLPLVSREDTVDDDD